MQEASQLCDDEEQREATLNAQIKWLREQLTAQKQATDVAEFEKVLFFFTAVKLLDGLLDGLPIARAV